MNETFYGFCSFLARTYYKLFFKIEIIGKENFDVNGQYVVCANHLSNHDPFLLGGLMPMKAYFMAKKGIFKYKIIAFVLNHVGVFPVDRESNDIKAIKNALTYLKNGSNLAIFPEGTRNKGDTPIPVKGGVTMLAYKTNTPVLPITIDTTYKYFSKIRIIYHPPVRIEAPDGKKLDGEQLAEKAQTIMAEIYSVAEYKRLK